MITRVILITLKPDIPITDIKDMQTRLYTLRQEYSGIFSIEGGEVFEEGKDWLKDPPSQDKYCVVLRFVDPPLFTRFSFSDLYTSIMNDLRFISAEVIVWDMNGQEVTGSPSSLPIYGNFSASVEDRLKMLFRLWYKGDGRSLTLDTVFDDLLPADDEFGIDLVQLEKAIENEFGIKDALNILVSDKVVTLGDLVLRIEKHLRDNRTV